MLNKNRLFQILFIISTLLFNSCAVNQITVSTKKPIEITIPSHANKLLLVDRSNSKSFFGTVVDAIGNDRMIYDKKENVIAAMQSFEDVVKQSPRFTITRASETMYRRGFRTFFPKKMTWDTVEYLCKKYDVDAIVAIEVFQTSYNKYKVDSIITPATNDKPAVIIQNYEAQGDVAVGFRIYDPKGKVIIHDEVITESTKIRAGDAKWGTQVENVLAGLRSKTIKDLCYKAGSDYAEKIVSIPAYEFRYIYKKGKKSESVLEGYKKAKSGEWSEAMSLWEAGISNAKADDASRLCYNIALAYENAGDIEKAKEYALRSNKLHDNFVARNYLKQLCLIVDENTRK